MQYFRTHSFLKYLTTGIGLVFVVFGAVRYLSMSHQSKAFGPVDMTFQSLASSADGAKLVTGTAGGFIYTSTDSGLTWTARTAPSTGTWIVGSDASGVHLVAAKYGAHIWTSSDSGMSWTERAAPGNGNWTYVASSSDGSALAVLDGSASMQVSSDSGATWSVKAGPRASALTSAHFFNGDMNIDAIADGLLYSSADDGSTWSTIVSTPHNGGYLGDIAVSADGAVIAGKASFPVYEVVGTTVDSNTGDITFVYDWVTHFGIFVSTDSGATWNASSANATFGNLGISRDGTRLIASDGGIVSAYNFSTQAFSTLTTTPFSTIVKTTLSSDGSRIAAIVNGNDVAISLDGGVHLNNAGYFLTYTASIGGSISGDAIQNVSAGGNGATVTAVADDGYTFGGWSDGVATASRTDTAVGANMSPTAKFFINSHSGWNYRTKITIDHTKVSNTDQLNFPILINTTNANWKSVGNGGHVASASGDDIVFLASDGVTRLDHEIEKYTATTGELVAWVRIPVLSHTTDTDIYMYYGNASVGDQSNSVMVWNSNYKMVQHLRDGTTLSAVDSTANGNNGTLVNAPSAISGKIGGGANVANGNYFVNAYVNGGYVQTSLTNLAYPSGTFSFWIYPNGSSNDGKIEVPWGQGPASPTQEFSAQKYNNSNLYIGWYASGNDQRVVVPAVGHWTQSAWNHYVLVWTNGTPAKLYWNGSLIGTASVNTTSANLGSPLYLGRQNSSNNYGFDGSLDEYEIMNTAVNADWVSTEYKNQSSPSTFFALAPEDDVSGFLLTYAAGPHGTITGNASQKVSRGLSGTAVTAVPSAHYHFVSWSDGSTANPRTDASVIFDGAFTATFDADLCTLTYAAGAHGHISGTDTQTVVYDVLGSPVIAVPDVGYHFVSWSDGVATALRTDAGAEGGFSVSALFAADMSTPPASISVSVPAAPRRLVFPTTSESSTSTLIGNTGSPALQLFSRTLHRGSAGPDVAQLQKFFNTHGFAVANSGPGAPGTETDFFGPLTFDAVVRFQLAHFSEILEPLGLSAPTGYFGLNTKRTVNEVLSK